VSQRTIYRDVDLLAGLGVPVYAEMGRDGGFRLMQGFFLPPVMFSQGEAISLLIGLALLDILRVKPYEAELASARHRLLAALPDHLRRTVARVQQLIGLEQLPVDIFNHDDLVLADTRANQHSSTRKESAVVTAFLQAILQRDIVRMRYHAPHRPRAKEYEVRPLGMIWDRERWYLVGQDTDAHVGKQRTFRSDRVSSLSISIRDGAGDKSDFTIASLLGRRWLGEAMQAWSQESPVKIRLTKPQAERLQRDWYYGHAKYEEIASGQVLMTFGADDRDAVFELLRWLGPGTMLLEPHEWREDFHRHLQAMLTVCME
jgi:predicted DNA-binding transcriptional regulator YafY